MTNKKRVINRTRSKSTGIILAVFFGCFAWLYTYKFDKAKFWLSLLIGIVLLGWTIIVPILVWIYSIVDMSVKDDDKYLNYGEYEIR